MASRQDLRRDFPYSVRVRCGKCQRVLGSVYGYSPTTPSMFLTPACSGMLAPGARVDWFRSHKKCSADWPVRWDKLASAFEQIAGRADPRERVLTLPFDLSA